MFVCKYAFTCDSSIPHPLWCFHFICFLVCYFYCCTKCLRSDTVWAVTFKPPLIRFYVVICGVVLLFYQCKNVSHHFYLYRYKAITVISLHGLDLLACNMAKTIFYNMPTIIDKKSSETQFSSRRLQSIAVVGHQGIHILWFAKCIIFLMKIYSLEDYL